MPSVRDLKGAASVAVEENEILGDPYVNCGGDHIEVRIDTRNSFRGSVFIKDQLEWPECRSAPIDASTPYGARNASIRLNFKVRASKRAGDERQTIRSPRACRIANLSVDAR